jgi:subtilisin family serine protease
MAHMNTILVLRDLAPKEVRSAGKALPNGLRSLSKPTVEVATRKSLNPRTLSIDKTILATAPVMMLKAYRPSASPVTTPPDSNWGLDAIGVRFSPYTGADVRVAIVDSGIDAKHPSFRHIKITPKDFSEDGPGDSSGHGTHCAGIIFGGDHQGRRIGIARDVRDVLDAKVFGRSGSCNSPQLVNAILWAAFDKQAAIVSLSLGFDFTGMVRSLHEDDNLPLDLATSRALDAYRANLRLFDTLVNLIDTQQMFGLHTILVAAAGNESTSAYRVSVSPPAIAKGIISVGAVGLKWPAESARKSLLQVADFSNTGPTLVAPGVDIVSAQSRDHDPDDPFCTMSGTSMATPHVAGVAALWAQKLAAEKSLSTELLIKRITTSASQTKFHKSCDQRDYGAGLIQAPKN